MRGRPLITSKRTVSKYYFTDYLYIIYRHDNDICLEEKKKISGLVYKLKHGSFHESFIHNLNRKLQVKGRAEVEKVGKVTYRAKRKPIIAIRYASLKTKRSESKLRKCLPIGQHADG